jgi:hypothetical protein
MSCHDVSLYYVHARAATGYLPYVGLATIAMTDYPLLKYALLVLTGLIVITSNE